MLAIKNLDQRLSLKDNEIGFMKWLKPFHKPTEENSEQILPSLSHCLRFKFDDNTLMLINKLVDNYFVMDKDKTKILKLILEQNDSMPFIISKIRNNWQMKRFVADLSYLRDSCGYPRLYHFDRRVNPSAFFINYILPFTVKQHRRISCVSYLLNKEPMTPIDVVRRKNEVADLLIENKGHIDGWERKRILYENVRKVIVSNLPILNQRYKEALLKKPEVKPKVKLECRELIKMPLLSKNDKSYLFGKYQMDPRYLRSFKNDVVKCKKDLKKLKKELKHGLEDMGFVEPKQTVKVDYYDGSIKETAISNIYDTLLNVEEEVLFCENVITENENMLSNPFDQIKFEEKKILAARELFVRKEAKMLNNVLKEKNLKYNVKEVKLRKKKKEKTVKNKKKEFEKRRLRKFEKDPKNFKLGNKNGTKNSQYKIKIDIDDSGQLTSEFIISDLDLKDFDIEFNSPVETDEMKILKYNLDDNNVEKRVEYVNNYKRFMQDQIKEQRPMLITGSLRYKPIRISSIRHKYIKSYIKNLKKQKNETTKTRIFHIPDIGSFGLRMELKKAPPEEMYNFPDYDFVINPEPEMYRKRKTEKKAYNKLMRKGARGHLIFEIIEDSDQEKDNKTIQSDQSDSD